MRVTLNPGNVVIITLVSFLGIIGLVCGMKLLAKTNVPLISSVAEGLDETWMKAAA